MIKADLIQFIDEICNIFFDFRIHPFFGELLQVFHSDCIDFLSDLSSDLLQLKSPMFVAW